LLQDNDTLTVDRSLLSVVLHDSTPYR
jgi:hypothetical protein